MQNLMLNRLAPILNPKNGNPKVILRPLQLNKGFSSFPDHFGQLENFFQVGLK